MPLGLRIHTYMWRSRLVGWLYRHDWHLAGVLAVAVIAVGVFVFWPRPAATAARVPVISAEGQQAAPARAGGLFNMPGGGEPGLSTRASSLRVSDAIVAAGGLTEAADPTCLPNLAAHLKDAKQIAVPFSGHCAKGKKTKVDINTATRNQLAAVPGMDASLADAIVNYREAYGGFVALTELKSAMGLDANTYKQLAKSLTVN